MVCASGKGSAGPTWGVLNGVETDAKPMERSFLSMVVGGKHPRPAGGGVHRLMTISTALVRNKHSQRGDFLRNQQSDTLLGQFAP
jgi:hypothetical protein